MVYCGKPSRGCQMCRTRRIKCDETKPTCNQCAKSRRQCPGYKDDFDLVFRNETLATERRARKASNGKREHGHFTIPTRQTVFSVESQGRNDNVDEQDSSMDTDITTVSTMTLSVPVEQQAPCFFLTNYVISPVSDVETPRGYFDFLGPLLRGEGPDSQLTLAFSAVSMASLANRPSSRHRADLKHNAVAQYTRALKATNLALQNPAMQKTDATLAAVLMLGFYETVCTENNNAMAWYSHIDGAVQLVRMRGKKSARTKIGNSLFQVVRTQMMVNCMTSAKLPKGGTDWWTTDDEGDYGSTITNMKLRLATLRYEMNVTLSVYSREPEHYAKIADIMRRAETIETECQAWEASLPEWWHPQTVAWVDNIAGMDFGRSEVCPGKIEAYHNIWVATFWNHARVARIAASGIIVRCTAWMCSPVDYRTTPEYAHAQRLCLDLVTDIISSMPFLLGWNIGKGSSASANTPSFEAGFEAFTNPKPIGGFFALWPLFVVSTADYCTDSQRTWAKARMFHIADHLGLNHSKVLANFQVRIPSMTIRRDNIGRQPPPTQLLPQKLYTPLNSSSPQPNTFPPPGTSFPSTSPVMNSAGAPSSMTRPQYELSPLQQREIMQKEAFERERLNLLRKAAGDQGESVERLMAKYLAV